MEEITQIFIGFLSAILSTILGLVLVEIQKVLKAKFGQVGVKTAEIIALNAVRAVEQIAKDQDIKGDEKLSVAKSWFITVANKQGLRLSDEMIDGFLESAVKSMKDSWNSTNTTDVYTTVPQLDTMVNMQPTEDLTHVVENYGK
ncbi:TPA: phage holin [Streptococcus suis]